ncbi:uncharacterized protein [Panulirus ornatus]|uniref:uncharacterized protein n=1 Tax=Panulirus ornatus TaxID=150431 RepID=UPI003A8B5630
MKISNARSTLGGFPVGVVLLRATLLLLLLLLDGASGMNVTEVASKIPAQWEHRYDQDVAGGDLVLRDYLLEEVHPRTALLCPKGFAIAKLRMLLLLGDDVLGKHPGEGLDVPYAHWLVKAEDGVASDEETGSSKCPTLQRCLGYQACLFSFGIELCHMDPIPGQRKNLYVTLTCMREEAMLSAIRDAYDDADVVQEAGRRMHLVLHLTYTSRLEESKEDFTSTEIMSREETEEEVFHGTCHRLKDAVKAGYRGHCPNEPPDPVDVSHALWSLMGRVPSPECRVELQQIYCSFMYQSKGLCLPPFALIPGQVNDAAAPELLQLSFKSFPQQGSRPDATRLSGVRSDPHAALIPVRLGFIILAHKDPPAVMQLLELIYRPQYHYVIHVDHRQADTRTTLTALLAKRMPAATNIRILPASRSFVASWGSFNIVRAELESFEELLRMGVWDHAVKLSGADLPLRDVDDLSAALAPYRGVSFVPLLGNRNKNMDSDQGLVWDVWHGCEGFVYNVTRGGGQPYPEEIPIYTGSQWSIMSRDLVDYALTPSRRSDVLNRWHFHLQTSIIPDESYFPTVTMNSPYVNQSRPLGFHWLKHFKGQNTINLCRHMEDADFCGQGPAPIEEEDLMTMVKSSHRYFFARKFLTQSLDHPTRVRVTEHVRTNYYLELKKYLPRALLTQLSHLAFHQLLDQLATSPTLASITTYPGHVRAFKVLPKLHLTDSCCSLPFERSFKSTQEFVYWIDFDIVDEAGSSVGGARTLVSPRPACDCYPDGHLRALRATTWPEDPNSPYQSALSTNMPLPYAMPGASSVFVELWFHVGERSVTPECRAKLRLPGTPMEVPNLNVSEVTGDPLYIVGQMLDPRGNVRCSQGMTELWTKDHVHPNMDEESVEKPAFMTLSCGTMEPGSWTLRVFQDRVEGARHYELPVVVLPEPQDLPLDPRQQEQIDLLQGLWTIDQVALFPFPDHYGDTSKLPVREAKRPLHQPSSSNSRKKENEDAKMLKQKKEMKEEEEERVKEMERKKLGLMKDVNIKQTRSVEDEQYYGFYHDDSTFSVRVWFVCGGGLLTTMLTLVFTYHWVVLPGLSSANVSSRMRRSAVFVFAAILLQILICSVYCR